MGAEWGFRLGNRKLKIPAPWHWFSKSLFRPPLLVRLLALPHAPLSFTRTLIGTKDRFPLVRKILSTLGLPAEAIDDIVERVLDWLSAKDDPATGAHRLPETAERTNMLFQNHAIELAGRKNPKPTRCC